MRCVTLCSQPIRREFERKRVVFKRHSSEFPLSLKLERFLREDAVRAPVGLCSDFLRYMESVLVLQFSGKLIKRIQIEGN